MRCISSRFRLWVFHPVMWSWSLNFFNYQSVLFEERLTIEEIKERKKENKTSEFERFNLFLILVRISRVLVFWIFLGSRPCTSSASCRGWPAAGGRTKVGLVRTQIFGQISSKHQVRRKSSSVCRHHERKNCPENSGKVSGLPYQTKNSCEL